MKIKNLLYTSLAASLLFASCDLNKQPVFDDATQAFIGYDKTSAYFMESVSGVPDTLEVTLYCASVEGVEASVVVEPTNTAYDEDVRAVEDVHYKILTDKVIKFDKDNRFATIKVVSINNDAEGSDRRFDLVLTNVQGCNMGANTNFAVRILDDENVLNKLLGTYDVTGVSAFQDVGVVEWTATISKDDKKDNTLWIHPITAFYLPAEMVSPVYAVADKDKLIISLPLGQVIYAGGEGEEDDFVLCDLNGNPMGALVGNILVEGDKISFDLPGGAGIPSPDGQGWYDAITSYTFVKQ